MALVGLWWKTVVLNHWKGSQRTQIVLLAPYRNVLGTPVVFSVNLPSNYSWPLCLLKWCAKIWHIRKGCWERKWFNSPEYSAYLHAFGICCLKTCNFLGSPYFTAAFVLSDSHAILLLLHTWPVRPQRKFSRHLSFQTSPPPAAEIRQCSIHPPHLITNYPLPPTNAYFFKISSPFEQKPVPIVMAFPLSP